MTQTSTASITREDGWYIAQCLEVDVASQGRTDEEAILHLHEALELHLAPPVATILPEVRSVEVEIGAAAGGDTSAVGPPARRSR